jgi:uncharacterized protein (TIGR02284 family)
MATAIDVTLQQLNHLYWICKAGEKGLEVAAVHINNRGLKTMLKTYAHQRAQMADELRQEIVRLGDSVSSRQGLLGILGMIHRGRIDIFATLTIGAQNVENSVLGEVLTGERAAVQAYRSALASGLAGEIRALVERRAALIQAAYDHAALLRGHDGRRMVVWLFDSEHDSQAAVQALQAAGFAIEGIDNVDFQQVTHTYTREGSRVVETVISGAAGGALWGTAIGALAGFGAGITPGMPLVGDSPLVLWAMITLSGLIFGALIASFLGFVIGVSVSEQDAYVYEQSLRQGAKLVRLTTETRRAAEAVEIMRRVNAEAREQATDSPAPSTS